MTEEQRIFICSPRIVELKLVRFDCPTCMGGYRYGKRDIPPRRFKPFAVAWVEDWYGWTETCLGCGDSWGDGERLPRSFSPGWRAREIAHARHFYRNTTLG